MGFSPSVTADRHPRGTESTRRWALAGVRAARMWEWGALVVPFVGTGAFLLHETRGTTLWYDEWIWALGRRGDNVGTFLRPHNGHLSLIPIAIYRLLFATAGLTDYTPYRVVVTLAHLLCGALVYVYARRRVGSPLSLLAAALILFLGPAYQNFLWPFQVAWLISLAAGLGALLALDRGDRAGDVAASVLLAVALASSGIGLPIAAGLVVEVLWVRRRWRDLWIVVAPLIPYVAWWIGYQDNNWVGVARAGGISHPVLTGILDAPRFVADSAGDTLSAVSGLAGQPGLDGGLQKTISTWAPALGVAAVVALGWRLARLRHMPPRAVTLAVMALAFWALTAVSRGFISDPSTSRYLYVGALFVVLIVVELAHGATVGWRVGAVVAVLGVAAVIANIGILRVEGAYLRSQAQLTRAEVTALDITRPIIKPDLVANAYFGLVAGPYFAAEDALGSPAESPARLAAEPESARLQADGELVRMHGIALARAAGGAGGAVSPAVDLVSGGTVSSRGGCVTLRSAAVSSTQSGGELRVRIPAGGVVVHAGASSVALGLRRFADEFQQLGHVAPAASASLRIRRDLAARSWHLQVRSAGRASVCGLG